MFLWWAHVQDLSCPYAKRHDCKSIASLLFIMLVSIFLNVVLAGSGSFVAAELLNTAWFINEGNPEGCFQNISGGRSY